MDQLNTGIFIKSEHWETMLADIHERNLEEACGLIAGFDQSSCEVYPVTNILHSPVRFRMDPEQQIRVFNRIEDQSWQLLAIYHSHLNGPEEPSAIDVAEANYPGVVNLIWSNTSGAWNCRGFLIEEGQIKSVPVLRL